MAAVIVSDYFYGDESEQFSYFRIPRLLVRSKKFKTLSTDAKLLYGLMLDRMGYQRNTVGTMRTGACSSITRSKKLPMIFAADVTRR